MTTSKTVQPTQLSLLPLSETTSSSARLPKPGICYRCDAPVESDYLAVKPSAEVCLDCMTVDEKRQLGSDLEKAMLVDRAMSRSVPTISGWEFAIHRRAARFLSGDLCEIQEHDGGASFSLLVGDVVGKGLPAALVRLALQSEIRTGLARQISVSELVNQAQDSLLAAGPDVGLTSLFAARIDIGSGRGAFVNAGHPAPLILRREPEISSVTADWSSLEATRPILGLGVPFDSTERSLSLGSSEALVLYSDGVTELESETGAFYDRDGLTQSMRRHYSASRDLETICRAVVSDMDRFEGSAGSDDRTLLLVRRRAAEHFT